MHDPRDLVAASAAHRGTQRVVARRLSKGGVRSETMLRRAGALVGLLLGACATCSDPPCAASVSARARLEGFVGPVIVESCMDSACTSTLVGAESCTTAVGPFPFEIEVCYFAIAAEARSSQLTLVGAAEEATTTIAAGATWRLSVQTSDGTLLASASTAADLSEREACGTGCLAGDFDFGTLEATAP